MISNNVDVFRINTDNAKLFNGVKPECWISFFVLAMADSSTLGKVLDGIFGTIGAALVIAG